MTVATISADIISSTSLSAEDLINLKKQIEKLFLKLEHKYEGFWGRIIKGDYIECVLPNPQYAFRIALIIKSFLKSPLYLTPTTTSQLALNGARIAIGIGALRINNNEEGIIDGEAIYLSGRELDKYKSSSRGTLYVACNTNAIQQPLSTIATLLDALTNKLTARQSQVIFHKLLFMNEQEIATLLNVTQSTVNQHSKLASWNAIDTALKYVENLQSYHYE